MTPPTIMAVSSENPPESDSPKNAKYRSETTLILFSLLYGILALAVIWVMTSGGMGVSYDSERYLISAHHFSQGETEQAFKIVSPTFPIFYPLTISIAQRLGWGDGTGAARTLSVLAFILSVLLVFHLGHLVQGKITAHLSAVSLLVLAPSLFVFSYCWSETLYFPLSLLSLLMLKIYLGAPGEKSTRYLMASGLLAGLGFTTRYIGIALILSGLLTIFLLSHAERMSKKIKELFSFGGMALLPLLLYLLGCQIYLNRIFRGNVPSQFSLLQQAGLFFLTIYRDFLTFYLTFDRNVQLLFNLNLQGQLSRLLLWSNLVIVLWIIMVVFLWVRTFILSPSFRANLRSQMGIWSYMVAYSLLVIGITSGVAVDRMGTRFLAPLYPLLLILAFSMLVYAYQAIGKRRPRQRLAGLSALAICLFWAIQIVSSYNLYKIVGSGAFPCMEQPGNQNRESLKFLQANAGPDDIVISNIPYKLTFIWPRHLPYLGISIQKDPPPARLAISEIPDSLSLLWPWEIKGGSLSPDSPDMISDDSLGQSHRRFVFILLCTKDFSHYSTPLDAFEELNQKRGLYSWKSVYGNDYIYKTEAWVFDSPRDKQRVLEEKLANIQTKETRQ